MLPRRVPPTVGAVVQRGVRILKEEGLQPLLHRVINRIENRYLRATYRPSEPTCRIMAEDWDNLLILDGCRYDQFKRLNSLPGQLEARNSLGSATDEFLEKNFSETKQYDTVYITANPMYRIKNLNDVFHDIIDVWKTGWDDQNKTVPPEEVVEASLDAHNAYPDKRLMIHFMQPHYPFIGEVGSQIGQHSGFEYTYRKAQTGEGSQDSPTIWELLEAGEIDEGVALEAYDENLEIVLPHVERLINEFPEKTVVTSDHGNFVGERITPFGKRRYGHPVGVYSKGLRKVPWLIVEGDERKKIQAESPHQRHDGESNIVVERLANLGYTDI